MLPFSPRLRIALATAELVAKEQQRPAVRCSDIMAGIVSLAGGVADNLLRARGFSCPVPAVPLTAVNHDPVSYSIGSLRAFSGAMHEAASRSRGLVGNEDMLVGILSTPDGEITALLAKKSVNVEELLSEVRRQM